MNASLLSPPTGRPPAVSPSGRPHRRLIHWLLLAVALAAPPAAGAQSPPSSAAVRRVFANPSRDYASAPLWVWNDQLTEEQIRSTLRDLAGQSVRQVFVHPRPGLMTPYLGPEWFRLWRVALDEARRLDMNVWIYDENSYPSGFAGGWVPELMPEARGRGLRLATVTQPPAWSTQTVAVLSLQDDQISNVSERVRSGESLPGGRYVVATVQRAGNSPWHGNRCYVDLLYPGVTEKFLEVTLEAYRRELGPEFGRRIPGVFTDEPELRPAGGFSWTEDLPRQFERRRGYPLIDHLPALTTEIGDWRRVRHDYHRTLLELFIERWGQPYYEYCARNGLEFTGHYWEHDWPGCSGVPDNMAMAAWQQRPGIDILMNQYAEHTHAQFGNVRSCREVASLANQLGRSRTLVELYGAGGWDLRFEDMKRIGDWLQVLGINTFDEHLSYVTLRGARKRDHPQSFSYHEPWWDSYHRLARYFSRLSAALTHGEQVHPVLVLEPTPTAWMYQGTPRLAALGDDFFKLLMTLERAQTEYDLGCEDVLGREAAVEPRGASPPALRVGRRRYAVVVLPPHTETLHARTWDLLTTFAEAGGCVVNAGVQLPLRRDGSTDFPAAAADRLRSRWTSRAPDDLPGFLRETAPRPAVTVERAPGDAGILFHHRREWADGQLLFLVNTSIDAPSAGSIHSRLGGVERWDPYSGRTEPYPFERHPGHLQARFELPPCGSLLLFLPRAEQPARAPARNLVTALPPAGAPELRRLQPNVLTLDYVDVTAGGQSLTRSYYYAANQFIWRQNGAERNPWDSAVQFRDELIRRTFPDDSGFTASYRFTVAGPVPSDLEIVVERPDLYAITCNGQPVAARPGAWWLDKAFGRIDLAHVAAPGENVVTLTARPFTLFHELEPAYVRGGFTLKAADRGFVLQADAPLDIRTGAPQFAHSVNPDGTMWLTRGIGFETDTRGKPFDDRQPWIAFDLGRVAEVSAVQVWNYNEGHVRDLSSRGVRDGQWLASTERPSDPSTMRSLGPVALRQASGAAPAETLPLRAAGVRYLRLQVNSNHAGVRYPAPGADLPDHGFVGLAEVRFLDAQGAPVQGVRVLDASSELASHGRSAGHVADGSGLVGTRSGWNTQGHPFYAHGVACLQRFALTQVRGRYQVRLPDWHGSVAEVRVNGRPAEPIHAAPWTSEVTPLLRRGENTVEVVVIGTLKNLLGPHHGNPGLGSAWPGMFQKGSTDGPPPGDQYHTVAYGLFAPPVLEQIRPAD